jgi:hypothetical protein
LQYLERAASVVTERDIKLDTIPVEELSDDESGTPEYGHLGQLFEGKGVL